MTHHSTADHLWAHMSAARWFSGKGRGGRLIALTALSPVITEPSVRHVIATVGYPEGPDEYYQLLLSAASKDDEDVLLVDSEGAWRDATNDPDALLAWARAILSGPSIPQRVVLKGTGASTPIVRWTGRGCAPHGASAGSSRTRR